MTGIEVGRWSLAFLFLPGVFSVPQIYKLCPTLAVQERTDMEKENPYLPQMEM